MIYNRRRRKTNTWVSEMENNLWPHDEYTFIRCIFNLKNSDASVSEKAHPIQL